MARQTPRDEDWDDWADDDECTWEENWSPVACEQLTVALAGALPRNDAQCMVCGKPAKETEGEGRYFTIKNKRVFFCHEDAKPFIIGRLLGQGELHSKVIDFLSDMPDDATGYGLKQRLYTIVPARRRIAMERQRLLALKPVCPRDIYAGLNRIVVGQERAKRDVSLAVYEHLRAAQQPVPLVPDKHHILLLGCSGTGKTLISETVARMLEVPFVSADSTGFSPTGFQGHDVDTVVHDLLIKSAGVVQTAERGIVLLDELDKITVVPGGANREFMHASTQASMLRLVEGKDIKVPGYLLGDTIADPPVIVNTSRLLFFFGGAFEGLAAIAGKKMGHREQGIGMRLRSENNRALEEAIRTYDILATASPEVMVDSLIEFGMATELVGRIPVVVPLAPLTKPELRLCLLELDHSPVVRQQALFAESHYRLEFTEDLVAEIVHRAHTMATGTRALKYLIKRCVSRAAFDLLGGAQLAPDGSRVLITLECLEDPATYEVTRQKSKPRTINLTEIAEVASRLTLEQIASG